MGFKAIYDNNTAHIEMDHVKYCYTFSAAIDDIWRCAGAHFYVCALIIFAFLFYEIQACSTLINNESLYCYQVYTVVRADCIHEMSPKYL